MHVTVRILSKELAKATTVRTLRYQAIALIDTAPPGLRHFGVNECNQDVTSNYPVHPRREGAVCRFEFLAIGPPSKTSG